MRWEHKTQSQTFTYLFLSGRKSIQASHQTAATRIVSLLGSQIGPSELEVRKRAYRLVDYDVRDGRGVCNRKG